MACGMCLNFGEKTLDFGLLLWMLAHDNPPKKNFIFGEKTLDLGA
jgi:hypothetical protein